MLLLILYNDFVDKKNMIQLQNIKQELKKSVLPVKNIEHHRTLVPLRWNWPGGEIHMRILKRGVLKYWPIFYNENKFGEDFGQFFFISSIKVSTTKILTTMVTMTMTRTLIHL